MQESFKYTDRVVVTFVILGIVLLITFSTLVVIKNKTLVNRVYYQTILDNASGLSSSPPIYFKGFEIGRIDDFELDSATNNILVKFYIYENYTDKIVKYAVISRIDNLVLGTSSQYELLLPRQGLMGQLEPLQEGELVPFITSDLGQIYVEKGQISVKLDSIESTLTSVNNVLLNLQKVSDPEAGAISNILAKVSDIADSFAAMTRQAEDEQLVPELYKTLVALQTLIDTSNSIIVKAEQTVTSANAFFRNAKDVARVTGSVVEAYKNPTDIISRVSENKIPGMIENVDANLLYLKEILEEVHSQREQLTKAIISLNKTIPIFDKTLQGISNNPLFKDGIESDNKAPNAIEIN